MYDPNPPDVQQCHSDLTFAAPGQRLWWDHWCTAAPGGVYHNQTQYRHFISTVRRLSPETLILPGPDGTLADVGEINPGVYPIWNTVTVPPAPADGVFQCNPNPVSPRLSQHRDHCFQPLRKQHVGPQDCIPCPKHPTGSTWLPVESDGTIQGCPLCAQHWWFWAGPPKADNIPFLTPRQLYAKYLRTVGRGINWM